MQKEKAKNRYLLALSSMLLLAISAPGAMAAIITYDFQGALGPVRTGIFADGNTGLSATGAPISGTFSFDDGLVDSNASTSIDNFRSDFPNSPNDALAGSFSASITVGSVTRSHTFGGPPSLPAFVQVADLANQDRVVLSLGGTPNIDPQLYMSVLDNAANNPGDPDGVADGSNTLMEGANSIADSGILDILDNLDISKFDTPFFSSWRQPKIIEGTGTTGSDLVLFQWTGIQRASSASVPEPATLALLGLGLFGLGFSRLRRRN